MSVIEGSPSTSTMSSASKSGDMTTVCRYNWRLGKESVEGL